MRETAIIDVQWLGYERVRFFFIATNSKVVNRSPDLSNFCCAKQKMRSYVHNFTPDAEKASKVYAYVFRHFSTKSFIIIELVSFKFDEYV